MRNATTTRRSQRLLAGAFVLCFAGLLGGCSSLPTPSWDPTDLLDFLDTKKRAPGERKPVFPEGVPGITPGVPKDMVRGSAESRAASDAQAAAAAAPPPEPPPTKRSKSAGKRPPSQTAAAPQQVEIAPDDVNVEEESVPAMPAPPPRRQARTRTTAPPPDRPQANPFPAPLPQR
jgi:hypothetical protein